MKHKIVLVPFPFDDLSSAKVRPAVCLTDEIEPYGHIVVAFITSRLSSEPSVTDLNIDSTSPYFETTGLKVSSAVRLHRLMTISRTMVKRELGELAATQIEAVNERLRKLFAI
ncbi:MAG: type II toxin-antitoxin system PemK/MazF family toxin [Acidobacteriota bacterium]|nr:MAG: type II toxin-antitoxin system PemK/MazF family toxin [Acidobacteriota bacterium]